MAIFLIIGACLILIFLFVFISQFNTLNKDRNQIENAISSLDALFIKRSDLIPNLVAVVKKYMTFETGTLEKITAMRTTTSSSNVQAEKVGNEALKSILVQVENYPELKADTQFTNLQFSWNEVEEQISAGRRYVSAAITAYNDSVTTFPGNVVAGIIGFSKYEWQNATKEQQKNIEASDLLN